MTLRVLRPLSGVKMTGYAVTAALLFSAVKLWGVDVADRTHPFGSDSSKNGKYAPNLSGEDYGVQTVWGKPRSKDRPRAMLDKIQWLSHSPRRDVFWRRAFVFATLGTILLMLAMRGLQGLGNARQVVCSFVLFFLLCYFTMSYYVTHFVWRRTKFIDTHVRRLKSEMGLPQANRIVENPLI